VFSASSSAPCSRFYSLDMDFSVISPRFDVALLLHPPSCLASSPTRSLAPRCLGFPLSSSVLTRSVELCIIITPHLISSCPRPGSWFAFRIFFCVFSLSFFSSFSPVSFVVVYLVIIYRPSSLLPQNLLLVSLSSAPLTYIFLFFCQYRTIAPSYTLRCYSFRFE